VDCEEKHARENKNLVFNWLVCDWSLWYIYVSCGF
jgi:hypothetical protein